MGSDRVPIIAALISRYEGMDVLIGEDEKLYIGKRENYHVEPPEYTAYYDNSDKSLLLVSANQKLFYLLGCGEGYVLSQREMLRRSYHSEGDYAEFAALQKGILADLVLTKPLMFDGVPFIPPEEMSMRRKKGPPAKSRNKARPKER